jgi:hypothetical protein
MFLQAIISYSLDPKSPPPRYYHTGRLLPEKANGDQYTVDTNRSSKDVYTVTVTRFPSIIILYSADPTSSSCSEPQNLVSISARSLPITSLARSMAVDFSSNSLYSSIRTF